MTKLAPQFNWLLHDRPFSDWLRMQPSDHAAPQFVNKCGEKSEERKITTELKTSKRPDGSGFVASVINDGTQVIRVFNRPKFSVFDD